MQASDFGLARSLFPKAADVVASAFGGALPSLQVPATAVTSSEDGSFLAVVEADFIADEDAIEDEDIDVPDGYSLIEVPSSANVNAGDSVLLTLQGNKALDAGSAGWGDRVNAAAAAAATLAQEAKDIADAIGQYAWNDTSGTHVSTEEGVAEGTRNILLNSYGILLRAAANYLAALSQSGIAFYDGQGNDAANIVASFGVSGAQIGNIDETLGHSADQYKMLLDSSGLHIVFQGTQDVVAYDTPTEVTSLGVGFLDLLGLHLESYNGGSSSNYSTIKSNNKELYISSVSGYADRGIYIGDYDPTEAKHPVTIYGNTGVNGNLYLPNAKEIFGTPTGGTPQQVLGLNASDQVVINYGGYANQNVPTNIEGNEILLLSRGAINFRVGTAAAVDYAPTDWAYLVGSSSGNRVRYCKRGGAVFVEVWYESGAAVGTTAKTLGTLPAGFRPSLQVETCAFGNVNNLAYLRVNPGGGIVAKSMSGTMSYFKGCISFPV